MQKIKVTFLMYQIITGGIENCLLRLLDRMCSDPRYEITVISKRFVTEAKFLNFFKDHNIPLLYDYHAKLGKKPKRFISKVKWKLKRPFLKLKNTDVRQCLQNSDIVIDYFNCSFFTELKNLHIPKIGWYHSGFSRFCKHFETHKSYLEHYDKFVCLTDSFRIALIEAIPTCKDNVIRVYNPIDFSELRESASCALTPPTDERYFVFVGRMHDDKDHLTVINAFNLFLQKHPEAKLYFLGDGDKRAEYEKLVTELNLENNIIFTGTVENPLGYIKNAVANILSSPSEGLPTVLIEGACLETLNISSDCPNGPSEILLNGDAGLLFPIGNCDKLAEMMEVAWEKDFTVVKMIESATKHLDRFHIDSISSQVDLMIDDALKKHQQNRRLKS